MSKSFKIYLILFAVVTLLLILLQLNKSILIDWRKSFDIHEKHPFGLYIFNQEIENLLGAEVLRESELPYDYYDQDSIYAPHNILAIRQKFTTQDIRNILKQVEHGSNFLYISDYESYSLQDTLKYKTSNYYYDQGTIALLDPKYIQDSIFIDKVPSRLVFEKTDKDKFQILGFQQPETYGGDIEIFPNYIVIPHGKGKIFMHTEPLFLTNFYLLQEDHYKYAENAFSYLPKQKTIWFIEPSKIVSTSPLRFVLDNPALRYAWYIMLGGMLLFIIFNAKRRQRVVPKIEPHQNMSAEFVKTIGNLYLQQADYKDMAHKKATYFLHRVRTDLLIDTSKLDELFWRRLKSKTGASDQEINQLKPLIEKALHDRAPVQERELIQLNQLINQIYP